MAFSFGFYNSIGNDRTYDADQFGDMFMGLIEDGVYSTIGDAFMVTPGVNLSVIVGSGRCWFNKTWSYNSNKMTLELEQSDLLLPRIDAVVIEINKNQFARENSIKVLTGLPSANPQKPTYMREGNVYQYPLAYVTVAQNQETIEAKDIEIVIGQAPCPFVTGILESVDITPMYQQWKAQFDSWFEHVKTALSEDTAGALLNMVEARVRYDEKATKDEAIAGVADNKWMTPALVKESITENAVPLGGVIQSQNALSTSDGYYPVDVLNRPEAPSYNPTTTTRKKMIQAFGFTYGPVGVDPDAFLCHIQLGVASGPNSIDYPTTNVMMNGGSSNNKMYLRNKGYEIWVAASSNINVWNIVDTKLTSNNTAVASVYPFQEFIGIKQTTSVVYIVYLSTSGIAVITIENDRASKTLLQRIGQGIVPGTTDMSAVTADHISFLLGTTAYFHTASSTRRVNIVSRSELSQSADTNIKTFCSNVLSKKSGFYTSINTNILVSPAGAGSTYGNPSYKALVQSSGFGVSNATYSQAYCLMLDSGGNPLYKEIKPTVFNKYSIWSNIYYDYGVYDDGLFWAPVCGGVYALSGSSPWGGYAYTPYYDTSGSNYPVVIDEVTYYRNGPTGFVGVVAGGYNLSKNSLILYPYGTLGAYSNKNTICHVKQVMPLLWSNPTGVSEGPYNSTVPTVHSLTIGSTSYAMTANSKYYNFSGDYGEKVTGSESLFNSAIRIYVKLANNHNSLISNLENFMIYPGNPPLIKGINNAYVRLS